MSFHRVVKRNNYYYFRTRLPEDLKRFFGRSEVWKSLKTTCRRTAKLLAARTNYETEKVFSLIRSGVFPEDQAYQLASSYLRWLSQGNAVDQGMVTRQPVYALASATMSSGGMDAGPSLSEVIDAHVKEALTAGQWTEKTRAENESINRLLLDLLGSKRPFKEIAHHDLLELRDKLSRLPTNLNKKPEYRGKTVHEVLEMSVTEKISTSTLNKYLTRVSTLFKWAQKHKYISVNYAEGLTLAKKRKTEEEREAYTKADLQRMVAALPCNEKNPERFWIPLIGMYSGLRLNEICQLHVDDIQEVDGFYCFDVNGKGERKVKTISSERVIPIHPVLVQLGFLDFVRQQQGKGHNRVWPNLVKKRDGYAQDFGKYFQRFNRANVTTNPKRVFHSLRHTVANQMKQAGVQDILISEILGHATESITMTRYGKSYRPAVMLEAMQKLECGVEDKLNKDEVHLK